MNSWISGLEKVLKGSEYNPLPEPLLKEYNKHRPLGPQKYVCYAPFKNIYFGHHGRAVACCYNRSHIIGEYPKQSIKEIWFGEAADKLRDYIKHNDFAQGCLSCQEALESGNFDGVKSKQYDELQTNRNLFPSVMEFELSNLCNLECEMCSGEFSSLIRAKREKLPPIESFYDDAFVAQLEEFIPYLEEVKFYGGEPFLIEIYYKIWEKIQKINPAVRISVQTNGTVLNNRVKEILSRTNFHLNISFDSLQKETYERIRKNSDFDRVSENIKYFRSYCKSKNTFFGISVCAMQQNWQELPDFIQFCNEMDAPVYFHSVFFPLHNSIRNMSPTQITEVVDYLSRFDFASGTAVRDRNRRHYSDFVNQVKAWQMEATTTVSRNKIANFEQLKMAVKESIESDKELAGKVKARRSKKVIEKLDELEKRLGSDFMKNIFTKVDGSDPSLPKKVSYYVDRLPLTALIIMARSVYK